MLQKTRTLTIIAILVSLAAFPLAAAADAPGDALQFPTALAEEPPSIRHCPFCSKSRIWAGSSKS